MGKAKPAAKPKAAKIANTPEPTAKRSDSATVAQRIEEVLRLLLDGAQTHDLVQFGSENGWNIGERQIRKYIARAHELLVERQEKSRKRLIAKGLAQREALIARCINVADLRTALAGMADRDKLLGLYPVANLKDLLKLAAAQEERIRKLESETDAADRGTTPKADSAAGPTPRPTGKQQSPKS